MLGFWERLKRPFLVLAPMDDVTDVVFRQVVSEVAPPDVYVTEFTNCEALWSPGRAAHSQRLLFEEAQRPIVAQIWGVNPENYFKTARMLGEMGFDGIDINMGCPDKAVRKSGACSALIDDRALAAEVIAATQEGAGNLPVSVKTRLGVRAVQTEDWMGWLLEKDLAVIAIHGRTVAQMSRVPADWNEIERAVVLRDQMEKETLIVGNGDVTSWQQAQDLAKKHVVDGVMIGRGIFQDLWVFDAERSGADKSLEERFRWLDRHLELWEERWGQTGKNPAIMKKFVKVYVAGLPGAQRIRSRFMEAKGISDMRAVAAQLIDS